MHVALCGNISVPVRVTDLVEASRYAASLLVYTRKKFFAWGVWVFVSDIITGGTFWPPWPTLPGPGCQSLGGSFSLRFLLEIRLQSESFDTLDDLLGFRVQKI